MEQLCQHVRRERERERLADLFIGQGTSFRVTFLVFPASRWGPVTVISVPPIRGPWLGWISVMLGI